MVAAQMMFRSGLMVIGILLLFVSNALDATANDWKIDVRFSEAIHPTPYTGRVFLMFTQRNREPRFGPNWFNPEPFLTRSVRDWKPGEVLRIDAQQRELLRSFPREFENVDLTGYRVQAVVRFNPLHRRVGTGAGNGFSDVETLQLARQDTQLLTVDRLVEPRRFTETKWSKLLRIRSTLLSDFHGRDVWMNAAVGLPASYYEQPGRRYPAIFVIPGFGGTHLRTAANKPVVEQNEAGVEFLRVLLDPSCPLGHHLFADSANNGPVGKSLIDELIPAFDRQFRSIADSTARFLTGHSSGGWSSLWLQITYPGTFAGTWSTSPDPVDFRDFQRINLYRRGENMYVDHDGQDRPLARRGRRVVLWFRGFADMEWALGHGGQLHSFEAVFSPRGPDGNPRLLWDRQTGRINTDVAETWRRFDIRLILQNHWEALGPKLKGKLHVFMGELDTFYLDGATRLLQQSLEQLSDDPVVEIHAGKDHGSIMTSALRSRIRREMVETFLRNHSVR